MSTGHPPDPAGACAYRLRYASLRDAARSLSFPCDALGRVPLDALTDRGRNDYLFARATVGRDFARPVVEAVLH